MTVSMANTFSSKVLLTRSWICRTSSLPVDPHINKQFNSETRKHRAMCHSMDW